MSDDRWRRTRGSVTRLRLPVVFVAWTLLVWATRIDNIVGADDLSGWGRAARLALAGSFLVLGVAATVGIGRAGARWLVPLLRVLAAWTIAVWGVRAIQIGLGDHAVGFVIVHTALAVISIGLALAVLRSRPAPVPDDAVPTG